MILLMSRLAGLALLVGALIGGPAAGDATRSATRHSLEQVQSFWRHEYPLLSRKSLVALKGVVLVRHGQKPPDCGDTTLTSRQISGNALYCPATDSIIIDENGLARRLSSRYGPFALTTIIAHEFGHSIQRRLGAHLEPLIAENQADCYAGAFAADSLPAPGEASRSVASPLLGLLSLADPPGSNPDRRPAHGTGFDRVVSFLDGFDHGVRLCTRYGRHPRPTTSIPYQGRDDRLHRGNLAIEDAIALYRADLDRHYRLIAKTIGRHWIPPGPHVFEPGPATCPGAAPDPVRAAVWCPSNAVVVSITTAGRLNQIGDFAVGADMGRAWATGAQQQFPAIFAPGLTTTECLTGLWIGTLHPNAPRPRDAHLKLSPGDLDEVVRAILLDRDQDALARLRALFDGFYRGLPACSHSVHGG